MWPEIKTDYERLQDDVVAEITKTSDYRENGHWGPEDIKRAVGRVLIAKMGISH